MIDYVIYFYTFNNAVNAGHQSTSSNLPQWRGALKTRAMAEFDSQPRRPTPKLKIAGLKAACAQRGLKGGLSNAELSCGAWSFWILLAYQHWWEKIFGRWVKGIESVERHCMWQNRPEKKSQEMRQALLMQWPMRRTACKLFAWRPSETMWNLSKNAVKLFSILLLHGKNHAPKGRLNGSGRVQNLVKRYETRGTEALRDVWAGGVTVSRLATIRICNTIAACLDFPGLQFLWIKSATLHKKWVSSNCRDGGCPLSPRNSSDP